MEKSVNWATVFVEATDEVSNYSRLLCLLVEQGTARMQEYMLAHLPEGCVTLDDAVKLNEPRLRGLQKNGIINKGQIAILFPTFERPLDLTDIDMSLWYILITNLSSKVKRRQWSRLEHKRQLSTEIDAENDIVRLRNLRNTICHLSPPQIDNQTYTLQWKELCDALVRLGTPEATVRQYEHRVPDHKKTLNHIIHMKDEVHSDVEAAYRGELKRRRQMMWGLAVVAVLICIAAVVICAVTFIYSKTWSSCIKSMEFKITSK